MGSQHERKLSSLGSVRGGMCEADEVQVSIAKVRIAPVERWCQSYQAKVVSGRTTNLIPGMEIPIIPASGEIDPADLEIPHDHELGCRWWRLPDDFVAATGKPKNHRWICEHVLEMD
jgi:hypothetical protein